MSVVFKPVETFDDQQKLAELAGIIWREYWPALIGADQTEYMIENFQSLEAIKRDMAIHAYEYWFVYENDPDDDAAQSRIVGYTGGHSEPETNRFFISKIYLKAEERGKHFASRIVEFYTKLCVQRGFDAMYLRVYKYNEMALRAYKAKGFEIIDATETVLCENFIAYDFIMQKTV